MANGLEFAMPIALCTDFAAASVKHAARHSKDGAQTGRLLALAAIYDGPNRTSGEHVDGRNVGRNRPPPASGKGAQGGLRGSIGTEIGKGLEVHLRCSLRCLHGDEARERHFRQRSLCSRFAGAGATSTRSEAWPSPFVRMHFTR